MRRKLLIIRRIVGSSMEPTFKAGQVVLASGLLPLRERDVVVLTHGGLEKIKRIKKLENGKIFVVGDNSSASTDSRSFGWLDQSAAIAKVFWPRV